MYLPCWSSFLQKVELHRKSNCQLDVRLRVTWIPLVRAACMLRDVDWPETKFSWSLGFLRTQTRQVYIEREELTILLRVVLLLLVRLYLILAILQAKKQWNSRQWRFSVKWGKEIWLELTRTKLDIKIKWYRVDQELGCTYSELSCEFYRCHPIHSDKYNGKSEHSFNWKFWKLASLPWTAR